MELNESFLSSCSNDKVLGQRIMAWQQANAKYLQKNILFPQQAQAEYEQLVEDGTKCLIAFLGCKQVLSKLPRNAEESRQTLEAQSSFGKWCLSNTDSQTIELIVERLISLQTLEQPSNPYFKEGDFNPYNLLSFKLPALVMGEKAPLKPWMCEANIAQIRNQVPEPAKMVLTAMLATQQSNEDTAAEISKITEADFINFTEDDLIDFASCCGLALSASGKSELKANEKNSLKSMLNLLKTSYFCGLSNLAKYSIMVLINYMRPVEENQESIAFRTALGLALQAIDLPRNSSAFTMSKFERGAPRVYETALKHLIAAQSCFKSRALVKGNETKELNWDNLQKRYTDFLYKTQKFKERLAQKTDVPTTTISGDNGAHAGSVSHLSVGVGLEGAKGSAVSSGSSSSSSTLNGDTANIEATNTGVTNSGIANAGATNSGAVEAVNGSTTKTGFTSSGAVETVNSSTTNAGSVNGDAANAGATNSGAVEAVNADATKLVSVNGDATNAGATPDCSVGAESDLSRGCGVGAGADSIDVTLLPNDVFSERELEVIREFIEAAKSSEDEFSKCYHNLCFIDWTNRLEKLLDSRESIRHRKKKLSEITASFLIDKLSQQQEQERLEQEQFEQEQLKQEQQEQALSSTDENAINASASAQLEEVYPIEEVSPILNSEVYNTLNLADIRPNKLTDEERLQIERFFNEYRSILAQKPQIFEEWEGLLCQQKVECNDFVLGFSKLLVGLASAQAELIKIELVFKDFKSTAKFLGKYNHEFCAYFSIMYGSLFRSLQEEFPDWFEFKVEGLDLDVNPFIDFAQFLDKARNTIQDLKSPKLKDRGNKQNHVFTFDVTLHLQGEEGSNLKHSGSVLWSMPDKSLGFELCHDLDQILAAQSPLFSLLVRNVVSAQGSLQNLSLGSIDGLKADPNLKQGSFIPTAGAYLPDFEQSSLSYLDPLEQSLQGHNLSASEMFLDASGQANALDNALDNACDAPLSMELAAGETSAINYSGLRAIKLGVYRYLALQFEQCCPHNESSDNAWSSDIDALFDTQKTEDTNFLQDDFLALSKLYVQAIDKMRHGALTFPVMKELYDLYSLFQVKIMQQPKDSSQLKAMLQIVLSIGLAYEYRDQSHNQNYDVVEYAVATPYNIQSMYNHTVQISRLVKLIDSMFTQKIFITKRHCLLDALSAMQDIPAGPEVVVPKYPQIGEPYVLQAIESKFGYTLYRTVFSVLAQRVKDQHVYNHLLNSYCSSSFTSYREQADMVVKYLKDYAKTYPQVLEHFNVVLFELNNLDVLYELYKSIQRDDFFVNIKLFLYVYNENQTELSFIYNYFETKCSAHSEEYEELVSDGRVQLIMLSKADLKQMLQNVDWVQKTLSNRFNDALNEGNDFTALNTATQLGNLYAQHMLLDDDRCLFHAGILFHACDSKADFRFIDQKMPVSKSDSDLFHADVNFALVQEQKSISNMFLVSAEQNLGGLIYLHSLFFLSKEVKLKEINKLGEYLQAEIDSKQELPCTELIETPVPSFHLLMDRAGNSKLNNTIQCIHAYAQDVLILDSLLTRAQLVEFKIPLVQYHQSPNSNTNVFNSSTFGINQSQKYLSDILSDMKVPNNKENCSYLLNQSLELSGGLIQHAKLSKVCTSEVLGLVISKYIGETILLVLNNANKIFSLLAQRENFKDIFSNATLQAKIKAFQQQYAGDNSKSYNAFFMLDEYASWFGSKTGERSDILVMNISKQSSGRYFLRIMIIESKFYSLPNAKTRSTSISQTKATAEIFFELFSHDNAMCTVDRQLRLRQLKNMLATHTVMCELKDEALKFQQDLIMGNVDVSLHALSFVYGAYEDADTDKSDIQVKLFTYGNNKSNTLPSSPVGAQFLFNKKATSQLVTQCLPCIESNQSKAPKTRRSNSGKAQPSILQTLEMLVSDALIDFVCSQMRVALDAQPAEKYKRKTRIRTANQAGQSANLTEASQDISLQDGKAVEVSKVADGMALSSNQAAQQSKPISAQSSVQTSEQLSAQLSGNDLMSLDDELDQDIYDEEDTNWPSQFIDDEDDEE